MPSSKRGSPTTDALRVVKVGGSLLASDEPASQLRAWLNRQKASSPQAQRVLLVGGGRLVDTLRQLDRVQSLGDDVAHWAAIDLMGVNAAVVAQWLQLELVAGDLQALRSELTADIATIVYNPQRFLRQQEPTLPGTRLQVGWQTTSDSIAARVATALGASLTLLKSAAPPHGCQTGDWQALAEWGYVDAAFPALAGGVGSISVESLSGEASWEEPARLVPSSSLGSALTGISRNCLRAP